MRKTILSMLSYKTSDFGDFVVKLEFFFIIVRKRIWKKVFRLMKQSMNCMIQ